MKVEQTMTVAQAMAAGYTKCFHDGYSSVEEIGDLEQEEIAQTEYYLSEKEPSFLVMSAKQIRDLIADDVRNQSDFSDEDDEMGQSIDAIDESHFETLCTLINSVLEKHTWWMTTNILLVPDNE